MKSVLLSCGLAFAAVTGADAATFSGHTNGSFQDAQVGAQTNSCLFDTAAGSDTGLAWGEYGTCPMLTGTHQDSRVVLQTYHFNTDLDATITRVQIGKFYWINRRNNAAVDFSPAVNLRLNVTGPSGHGAYDFLRFHIDNTQNTATGTNDLILVDQFDTFNRPMPFMLPGGVQIRGFSFGLLGDTTGQGLGATRNEDGSRTIRWSNPENTTSHLGIFAHVRYVAPTVVGGGVSSSSEPTIPHVPLPPALLMLGAGLAALFGLRRKRA